jgi:transcriptional regulator with XRE-family HTH domain
VTPEQLRNWRKKRRLTQIQLAEQLGVYRGTIIRWEAGQQAIPPFLELALKQLDATHIGGTNA